MGERIRNVFIRPEDNRLRFIWKFSLLIITSLVLGKIVGASLGLLFSIYYAITRGQVIDVTTLSSNPSISLFTLFIEQILMIWITMFFIKKIDKKGLREFGVYFNGNVFLDFLKGLGLSIVGMGVVIILLYFAGLIRNFSLVGWSESVNKTAFFLSIGYQTLLFLLVGFQEELLFRAYMIRDVYKDKKWPVIIVTSLLFMLMHISNPGVTEVIAKISAIIRGEMTAVALGVNIWLILVFCLNIFLFGVGLATYFVNTKKFGTIVGIHFGWNFIQSVILGFNISGINLTQSSIYKIVLDSNIKTQILTGGKSIGPEAGICVTTGFLVMIVILFFIMRSRKKVNEE